MSICILTDTTALFPPISASYRQYISVIPVKSDDHHLIPPEESDYIRIFDELEKHFNAILVLTTSEGFLPTYERAKSAAQFHGGMAQIRVFNTKLFGPGLGVLTQLAARKAASGENLSDIEEYLRSIVPYIFTIIFPSNSAADLDNKKVQGVITASEKQNTGQIFTLEDGQLNPYKKVRTQRHLLESFQDFLGEFEKPQHLVYFHGKNTGIHARPLREASNNLFPGTNFNDLELNDTLTIMFGENSVGFSILESPQNADWPGN